MIKIENVEISGWTPAIRGMRNPMNSWAKSDSGSCDTWECSDCGYYKHNPDFKCGDTDEYLVGPNDHNLMMNLAHGGPVHAKYRRMITVYLDITAPLYWWKEFDTYKIGTVANSCSTMHKIHSKEFTRDDFSVEHLLGENQVGDHIDDNPYDVMTMVINCLNYTRDAYLEYVKLPTKDTKAHKEHAKKIWYNMIQLLPSSYNQKRTVMLNYEVLAAMYESRKHHKLDEWREFCRWIESLPYSEVIIGEKEVDE